MMFAAAVHVGLLAASVLSTAVLAAYAWRHREAHAVRPFGGLMAGFTLYSGAHLVGLLVVNSHWRLVWENLQWTGAAVIPLFWLVFAMEYTGYSEMLTRRTVAALAVLPAATVLLAWTNSFHGLMWAHNTIVVTSGLAVLEQQFGPWGLTFTILAYGMFGVGAFLIVRLVWLSDHLYVSQALLLLVGLVVPLVANGLTVLEVTPIRDPSLDLTPYAFSITGLAYGYALFRDRLLDVVPATHQLGRDAAIRDLQDGVVIADTDRRMIYCNPAVGDLLDVEPRDVLGEPVRMLVDDATLDFDAEDALAEVECDGRVYEVRTSPIRATRERLIGHTLLVQDVTARKRREEQLTRQRDELVRLDTLNAVIRGVNTALISASSRQEIEQAVCDRLAEPGLYRTVCVADIPTWNGEADRWAVATTGGATERAVLPGGAIRFDADEPDPTVSTASDRSGTWTVVPLCHGRTVYGALGLQPAPEAEPDPAPSDREREVLAELGRLIGQAVKAVETRQLLAAESVVELELHCSDERDPLVAVAVLADQLAVTGFVPDAGTDDNYFAYVDVSGGSTTAVAAVLGEGPGTARVVQGDSDAAKGVVEWTVPADTPLGTLADQGANVLEATVADGTARYLAEVATETGARAVIDRVQADHPDACIKAMRQRDRPAERADSVPGKTVEDLTDRQQEALEVAYRAGYYDWPRESTAEDVADTLEITAPTLHAHLRKAESSLLAELFDRESSEGR
jgi:PAS domain-containing protein